jgi:hypothetical protein
MSTYIYNSTLNSVHNQEISLPVFTIVTLLKISIHHCFRLTNNNTLLTTGNIQHHTFPTKCTMEKIRLNF